MSRDMRRTHRGGRVQDMRIGGESVGLRLTLPHLTPTQKITKSSFLPIRVHFLLLHTESLHIIQSTPFMLV